MLTGDEVVLNHPGVDWARQTQHLFRDNLRAAARVLIDDAETGASVINYARFQREVPVLTELPELADLVAIFARCERNLSENPLFWVRIVGYAYACSRLIADQGVAIGFENVEIPVEDALKTANDPRSRSGYPITVRSSTRLAQGL